jgi:hypothetical protein
MADAKKQNGGKRTEDVFTWAPSPFDEIKKLEYGTDSSFAFVVQKQVLSALPAEFPALERRLLDVFKDKKATTGARHFVCRMLAFIGSEACLGTIAPLLTDARMSHFARMALEPIAGKKVDDALRAALPKLSGDAKAGLIGTIGVRAKDDDAIAPLTAIKNDTAEPAAVREAATLALARIEA